MPNATATLIVEMTVTLTGNAVPYRPATPPSYSSGGDPPDGGYVEDIAIEAITYEVADGFHPQSPPDNAGRIPPLQRRYRTVNLLAGIDTSNPEIQKLLANLCEALEPEAQEEFEEEEPDYDFEPDEDED